MLVRNLQLRYVTLPYNVTIDGITWTSDNNLAALDPPKLSDNADREAFKISFADPSLELAGLVDEMTGASVSIYGSFFNVTSDVITDSDGNSVEVNAPVLCSKDFLVIHKGFIDSAKYIISEEDGALLELECASPMASLDAVNSFYSSRDSLKQRVPPNLWPDTAFDNVSLGGISQEILWGKI